MTDTEAGRRPRPSTCGSTMVRSRATDLPSLDDLIRRVRRLTPNWRNAEKFYDLRDGIADDLHRLARSRLPQASSQPAGPSSQERRLAALARALASEVERLRRMLAAAARPRARRRQVPDGRQLTLPI